MGVMEIAENSGNLFNKPSTHGGRPTIFAISEALCSRLFKGSIN